MAQTDYAKKRPHYTYFSSYHKQRQYKNNNTQEPLPYGAAFRLRFVFCIIFFGAFALFDGRRIDPKASQFIYQRLEEPMSKETIQTWAQGMKMEYDKISEMK